MGHHLSTSPPWSATYSVHNTLGMPRATLPDLNFLACSSSNGCYFYKLYNTKYNMCQSFKGRTNAAVFGNFVRIDKAVEPITSVGSFRIRIQPVDLNWPSLMPSSDRYRWGSLWPKGHFDARS